VTLSGWWGLSTATQTPLNFLDPPPLTKNLWRPQSPITAGALLIGIKYHYVNHYRYLQVRLPSCEAITSSKTSQRESFCFSPAHQIKRTAAKSPTTFRSDRLLVETSLAVLLATHYTCRAAPVFAVGGLYAWQKVADCVVHLHEIPIAVVIFHASLVAGERSAMFLLRRPGEIKPLTQGSVIVTSR